MLRLALVFTGTDLAILTWDIIGPKTRSANIMGRLKQKTPEQGFPLSSWCSPDADFKSVFNKACRLALVFSSFSTLSLKSGEAFFDQLQAADQAPVMLGTSGGDVKLPRRLSRASSRWGGGPKWALWGEGARGELMRAGKVVQDVGHWH